MFLDIIMVYAILNFIGTLAAAKYFEGRGEI
jgi:multisubunit Na+/H+ antiporter MnhF subunit